MSVVVVHDRDSRCRLAQVHANGHTGMTMGGAEAARARFHRTALNQRKGNQETATSIKHVRIDQLLAYEVTS
jgi:hypothetical protein